MMYRYLETLDIHVTNHPGLKAIIVLMIGLAAASAQEPAPILTIAPFGLSNAVKSPRLTFHNSSSAAATAWIVHTVSAPPKRVASESELVDTIIGHGINAIPSGADGVASGLVIVGNAATREWSLVAVLFADGTIAGDTGWAREIVLKRQYEFQILTALVSDLASVKGMDITEAVNYLEKSKNRQRESAKQASSAAQDRLAKVGSSGAVGYLYSTDAPAEFKSALVQFQAANGWGWRTASLYTNAEQTLRDTSTKVDRETRIKTLQARLQLQLHRLSESQPGLSDPALDPTSPR
jgi:hypothetical protein